MFWKIVFNEGVFLNTLGFLVNEMLQEFVQHLKKIILSFFKKELTCLKISLLEVFFDFVILI